MYSLATHEQLASAHVVFFGAYGAVRQLAAQRGACRQAIYRQAHAVARAIEGHAAQQRIEQLQQENARLQQTVTELQHRLADSVVLGADRLREFAATGQAKGVPFSAAQALLAVFLGPRTPSRAHLGRWARRAGRQASATLAVLDSFSRTRARQLCADEIFSGRRPVLMTAEQQSLCWLGGRLASNRDGQTWAEEFRHFPKAEQITTDRGQGLLKGLALVNRERQAAQLRPIDDQSDHFHPLYRGAQQLRQLARQAERALSAAEQAQRDYDKAARTGVRRTPQQGRALREAWETAEAAFDRWTEQEQAWQRLRESLRLFTPAGELHTPEQAAAEAQEALSHLDGPAATKLQRGLCPQAFTFLRQTHQRLDELKVAPELVQAALRLEGLRAQPHLLAGEAPQARARRGLLVAATLVLALAQQAGQQAAAAVREVLQQAWRASSLIEGLNSVLRMHQGRQKRLTQELLDLKRLSWNMHTFAAGKRKGKSPYEHLGLVLPKDKSWWQLIQMPPEQLRQELSALNGPP